MTNVSKEDAWSGIADADLAMVDCDDYEADDYLAQARSRVAKTHLEVAKMLFKHHEWDAARFHADETVRIIGGN